jgi:tRNA pseudouridine55 synthase
MDGIVLIDKPKGWTSFDVVAKVRNILRTEIRNQKSETSSEASLKAAQLESEQGAREKQTEPYKYTVTGVSEQGNAAMAQKHQQAASSAGGQVGAVRRPKVKVGHTGTLDPLATGLLIIVVGKYTKRAEEFSKLDKVYETEMILGQTSTTGDNEGVKTKTSDYIPEAEDIKAALAAFEGEIMQTPPIYSAIKIDGQRAYKLARAGKEVKIEPRKVTIYQISDIKYTYPTVNFTVKVSSGTYIRSLVEDIGEFLGTGAYMSKLRRLQVGDFLLTNAQSIEEFKISDVREL